MGVTGLANGYTATFCNMIYGVDFGILSGISAEQPTNQIAHISHM